MINRENYFEKVKKILFAKLPENLKKGFLFVQQTTEDHTTWKFYEQHNDIKVKVDRYFSLLNEHLYGKHENRVSETTARNFAKDMIRGYVERGDSYDSLEKSHMGTANSEYQGGIRSNKIVIYRVGQQQVDFSFSLKTIYNELKDEIKDSTPLPIKSESAPTKPKSLRISYENSKPFERIGDEIKFIKRYLSLHGKSKNKSQLLNFVNALQRAIIEKRIRKTSQYAKEIMQIQKQLVTACAIMEGEHSFELGNATLKRFSEIVGSARIRLSTQYLKRFVGIQGKNITKEKAKQLLVVIEKALSQNTIATSDPYFERISQVVKSLKLFIEQAHEGDTLAIHQQTLNGLNMALSCHGDCNCGCNKKKSKQILNGLDVVGNETAQVMSVEDVKQKKYNSVPLGEKWKALLGDICLPTHLFVYGSGGSGKTSFALLFTQHLASLGYRILYIAGEQFDTPPFTKLLNQLNIVAGDNYKIVGKLDTLNLADFDFVALDTKDSLEIDTMQFLDLKQQFDKQSFIIVSHGIKTGEFKGKEQWRNIVDVMVYGDNGTIITGQDKNRWGGAGEFYVYDHPSQYVIKE